MKDNFSEQAEAYSKYRPGYPAALFEFLSGLCTARSLAWDCGTGNGQSAVELSKYYDEVFATDISSKQINNAQKKKNIEYAVEPAEKTSLANESTDLITVSQALDWFHFNDFYAEVQRVAKPGSVIAVWTYSLLRIEPAIDAIVSNYHFKTLETYWDAERKYVDDAYETIPFPFPQIETPSFVITLYWTLEELEGYLNTWSALQKFISANNFNPVKHVIQEMNPHWKAGEKKKITFPIHLKAGYVNR